MLIKNNDIKLNKERKLLSFFIDWLTIQIWDENKDVNTESVKFLDWLFSLPHNDSNASTYKKIPWFNSNELVDIFFNSNKDWEIIEVHKWREKIIRVLKPDKTKNVFYKKKYVISFYWQFFDLHSLRIINMYDYFKGFTEDILNNNLVHSVSRLDVCADIAWISVRSIRDWIKWSRLKKITSFNEDINSWELSGFYYWDKKSTNKLWLARCYNKLEDLLIKNKRDLKKHYFDHEEVTRLELEIRSEQIRARWIDLFAVLNRNFVLSIFKEILVNKYSYFSIVSFVSWELKKNWFELNKVPKNYRIKNNLFIRDREFNALVKKAIKIEWKTDYVISIVLCNKKYSRDAQLLIYDTKKLFDSTHVLDDLIIVKKMGKYIKSE